MILYKTDEGQWYQIKDLSPLVINHFNKYLVPIDQYTDLCELPGEVEEYFREKIDEQEVKDG